MTERNLGFIRLGSSQTVNAFFPGALVTQTDTYAFRTGSVAANVAISTSASGGSGVFALALFRDNDASGTLNVGDTFLPPGDNSVGSFHSLNRVLSQGNYIARAQTFSSTDTPYTFRIARASTGGANPLTTPEIQLGTIDQDLTKRGSISNDNSADNYAFSLDQGDRLNIKVKELGNLSGDVNIRVVRDLDADGIVDRNEILVKGTSTVQGNIDALSVGGRGDYLLQICQGQGNVRYQADFDLVTANQ